MKTDNKYTGTFLALWLLILAYANLHAQDPYTDPDYEFYWQKGILHLPEDSVHTYSFYDEIIYLDIFFLDDQPEIGWACGYNSVILKTTDAGVNWDVIDIDRQITSDFSLTPVPESINNNVAQLETIQFLNENTGYVSGPISAETAGGCIYKSTNGGLNWQNITPRAILRTGYSLWGFHFWDEQRGVLLAQIGGQFSGCGTNIVFTTTDGGNTWNGFEINIPDIKFSDPLFLNRNRVLILGSSRIYEMDFDLSHNGQPRVTEIANTTDGFNQTSLDWHEEIDVIGNKILLPVTSGCAGGGGQGSIRVSDDFGQTWRRTLTPGANYGSFLIDQNIGWIAGQVNGAYYTIDGGDSWQVVDCGLVDGQGDDIYFTDPLTGYLAADGVYKLQYGKVEKLPIDTVNIVKCVAESIVIGMPEIHGDIRWNTGSIQREIEVSEPGVYTLRNRYEVEPTAEYPFCSKEEVFVWNVEAYPVPAYRTDLQPNTTDLCVGDELTMSFSGEATFLEWEDDPSANSVRTVTESGTYIAVSTDVNGCFYRDTVEVTFHDYPVVNLEPLSTLDFCIGAEAEIRATPGYEQYTWLKDGTPWDNSDGNVATVTETGYYSVLVENQWGCGTLSDSLFTNVRIDSNRIAITEGDSFDYFGMIESELTNCVTYTLENMGSADYTIEEIYFLRNVEFTFPSSQLPVTLPGGGSIDITACYSPYAMHDSTDRDTMFMSDQCSPHFLVAEGDPLIVGRSSSTECLSELVLRGIDEGSFALYERVIKSYPNPASESIRIESILRSEVGLTLPGRFVLMDMNGQIVTSLAADVIEVIEASGYYYSVIEFDLSEIPSGTYFIRDAFGEAGQIFNILK